MTDARGTAPDRRRGGRRGDAPDRPGRRPGLPDHAADADHPGLREVVADGRAHGEIVNVESEHSAMSAAIGAALAGARTMTATSSQGLALMAEVVYIAASMRAPIVMALGNRALSGPINIHCDHSDSMLIRDSGVDPALRRERAGGLRPDGASRRGSPSTRTCCCRCSSAWTASRSRTRPSRSSCSTDDEVRDFVGEYRIPHPLLDLAQPDDAGPVRDARLLLRAAAPAGRRDRGRAAGLRRARPTSSRPRRPPLRRVEAVPRSRAPSARSSASARPPAR